MLVLDKVKQDATKLLTVLLILHVLLLMFNRVPGNAEGLRFGQKWMMTALWPVQFVMAHGWGSFRAGWDHYVAVRDARAENDWLRAENAQLQAKLRDAEEKGRLLEQLDQSVKWQATVSYQAIHARVIGRDAQQWFNTVVIDAGSLTGVEKDMPVMTPDGLVGRVITVAPTSARVMLLTDERFGAGAIIGQLTQSRVLGIVKGRNNSLCEMRFINSVERVEPGEPVITSGQDGLYPRGLLIGRVRVNAGAPAAQQTFDVEPAAPFNKLDLVTVLRVPKEQIRFKVEQLVNAEAEKQQQEKALGRKK